MVALSLTSLLPTTLLILSSLPSSTAGNTNSLGHAANLPSRRGHPHQHQHRGHFQRRSSKHNSNGMRKIVNERGEVRLERDLPQTVEQKKRATACRVRTNSTVTVGNSTAVAVNATSSVVISPSSSIVVVPTTSTSVVIPTTTSSTVIAVPTTSSSSPSSAAAAAATTTTTTSSTSTSSLTPNGIKAGIAGLDSLSWMTGHIGWAYDWSPSPSVGSGVEGVSMLWGDGNLGSEENDASRLATFQSLTTVPTYILGYEEPDCSTTGSANIPDPASGASTWNSVIAPFKAKGSLLGSPSMCHQADETWLTPFKADITTDWDFTAVHINKNSMAGVQKDLDHYWNTYGKPIWVTEFACVDDSTSFIPCTDQSEINTYIQEIVDLLEADSRVYAYAYSDGEGLGSVWPTVSNGALSQSGQTYLTAISKYH